VNATSGVAGGLMGGVSDVWRNVRRDGRRHATATVNSGATSA
jgi:hypothetical protein